MRNRFAILAIAVAACGSESQRVDLAVAGVTPLGPVSEVAAAGRVRLALDRPVASKAAVLLAVQRRAGNAFLVPLVDPQWEDERSVSVTLEEPALAQLVTSGATRPAPRTWRAIAGVSMGADRERRRPACRHADAAHRAAHHPVRVDRRPLAARPSTHRRGRTVPPRSALHLGHDG